MIQGIDYAPTINGSPSLAGMDFAFVKATEGLHSAQADYAKEYDRILFAGLISGAYHFGWPTEDCLSQAEFFVEKVAPLPGEILFLDFEGYSDNRNWAGMTWAERDAWRLQWISHVRTLTKGRNRVGTYCNVSTWRSIPSDDPGDFLFIAWPEGSAPPITRPWTFWQTGISGVDRDVARFATRAQLAAWARQTVTYTQTGAPMSSTPYPAPWNADLVNPATGHTAQAADYLLDVYTKTCIGPSGLDDVDTRLKALQTAVTALTSTLATVAADVAALRQAATAK